MLDIIVLYLYVNVTPYESPPARLALCLAIEAPVPRIFFALFLASLIALRDLSFFSSSPILTRRYLGSNFFIASAVSYIRQNPVDFPPPNFVRNPNNTTSLESVLYMPPTTSCSSFFGTLARPGWIISTINLRRHEKIR
jgi:hypothetical protein